jgi:hypothetical protein
MPNDVFIPAGGAPHHMIPAAGNVPGANGTFFRTDISLINLAGTDVRVAAYWLPQNRSGPGAPKIIRIDDRAGFTSGDFVGEVLGESGLGSIELLALDAGGSPDPTALLHATVRIWTPEPNVPNGTMSQSFPAIIMNTGSFSSVKNVFGVRRDAQYRLNVGIVNPHNSHQRFRVTANPSSGITGRETFDLDLPARSMAQVVVPGDAAGTYQITFVNLTDAGANTSIFQAWASSVDNITGDAWSQVAFKTSQ